MMKATPDAAFVLSEIDQATFDKSIDAANFQAMLQRSDYSFFIIENEKIAVGYVSLLEIKPELELIRIAILPNYRNQGFAYQYLKIIFAEYTKLGFDTVFLEVSASNKPAIHLYEKIGFNQYNLRRNYYGEGDDAVLFKYSI